MAPNLYVFIPAFRNQMTATTMLTTHMLAQECWRRGIGFAISAVSWPDIADLRGMAATYLIDRLPQASHLLFIDDDMSFKPELVMDMLLFNEPVVGALYPKRCYPLEFAGSGSENPEVRGGFVKCDGVGMGVTLIQRHVFEVIAEKMPDTIDTNLENSGLAGMFGGDPLKRILKPFEKVRHEINGGVLSEDFSFCQRWRQCGGEVWASATHTIQHIGNHAFEGNFHDWSEMKRREKDAAGDAVAS